MGIVDTIGHSKRDVVGGNGHWRLEFDGGENKGYRIWAWRVRR